MKSRYIKPETEVVRTPGLMDTDPYNMNTNSIEGGSDADARGYNNRGNDNGYDENPFHRYNPWN